MAQANSAILSSSRRPILYGLEGAPVQREPRLKPDPRAEVQSPPSPGEVSSGPDPRVGQLRVDPRRCNTPPLNELRFFPNEKAHNRPPVREAVAPPTPKLAGRVG